ncbi:hypothetical protein [Lysobacter sp. F6437]|uniref:hypothetical protein n=1 Tax=Lysobacter sp. F6437 TaxID=3459296 RepID=UPI00403D560E
MSIDPKQDRSGRWLAIVASVVVLATVVVAVLVMDSPSVQRDGRLDSRRIDELNRIVQAIDTYVQANATVPPDLATLAAQPGQQLSIADPVTGNAYDYTVDGGRNYTLCAEFVTDTAQVQARGGPWNADEWNHDVGPQCFSRTATAPKPGSQSSEETGSPEVSGAVASAPSASEPPAARLALEGEGLRIFVSPSGSARPIAFGTGKAETLATLRKVIGAAPVDEGDNNECGATRVRWPGGLATWFVDDAFVGWSVGPDGSGVSTVDGLAIGSTRTALESGGSVVQIDSTTLGTEFTAGGVAGLLDSDDDNASVIHLWAGQTCIAR